MSESKAEMVLASMGMLAEDDTSEQAWEQIDKIFSGRPAPVKFAEQGDQILGFVTHAYTRQATVFGTNEPKTWDDGSPILEPVIELRTDEGPRSLYVSSWRMRNALQTAFQEAGVRGPRPGGKLWVQYYADEPGKPGVSPAKVYIAKYEPNRTTLGPSAKLPPLPEIPSSSGQPDEPPF